MPSSPTSLFAYFASRQERLLGQLQELVQIESPSSDKHAVDRAGMQVAAWLEDIRIKPERLPRDAAGDLYLARMQGADPKRQALLLCHMDTVWPLGTLVERPPRVEQNRYIAPGAADMKGGAIIALAALRAFVELGIQPAMNVAALFTSDEEIGSPHSRELIEQLSMGSDLVLCLEPGLPSGALKTARKGGLDYVVTAHGRAAHAGADHASGINAVQEMAHQVLALQALTDYSRGTTVSIGRISGGIATNIVPPACTIDVDIRVSIPEEVERMRLAVQSLTPKLPGAKLEIREVLGRPPMPRDERMQQAFEQARRIGARHGIQLTEGSTGGSSDANFAAALGKPVLDGLGAVGGRLHAVDEYIEIASLPERACLLAAILGEWQF